MSESEVDRIRIGPLGFSFDKGKPLIGAKVSKVRVRTTVPAPNAFPPSTLRARLPGRPPLPPNEPFEKTDTALLLSHLTAWTPGHRVQPSGRR